MRAFRPSWPEARINEILECPHIDSPPHVGTDPVSVRYPRGFFPVSVRPFLGSRMHAQSFVVCRMTCLFCPCRTDGADRHGVCPYIRAFRPSWPEVRINEILECSHIDSPPHVGTDPVSVRTHVDSSRQRFCQLRAVWILPGRDSASLAPSGFFPAEVLPTPRRPDSSRQRFCQPRAVWILPGRDSASSALSGICPGRGSASQYNVLSPYEIKSFLF